MIEQTTFTTARVDLLVAERRLTVSKMVRFALRDVTGGVEIPYRDLDGKTVATRTRQYLETAHPTRWTRSGGPTLPYTTPAMMAAARKAGEVTVVEGESDVWALAEHTVPAIGIPGSTMTSVLAAPYVSDLLRIYVVREPDDGGAKFVVHVEEQLRALGWDGELRVVDLHALFDVKDPCALHVADPDAFPQRWAEAVAAAQPIDALSGTSGSANGAHSSGDAWPERDDVDAVAEPKPLPIELVPGPIRPFIDDTRKRLSVPVEFIAVPLVVSAGALIGPRAEIEPEGNGWTEHPNLWGGLVAGPGMMKSPAMYEALAPLRKLADAERDRYAMERDDVEHRHRMAKLDIDALETQYRQARKAGSPTAELEADLQRCRAVLDDEPTERRYLANDATAEKISVILAQNKDRGLLQYRDEMAGWLHNMDRPGRESDRAFYLESWGAKNSFTVDRISRGTTYVERVCLSVLGTIQPGPLQQYFADAMSQGLGDDGLIQRFGLLAYCSTPVPFIKANQPPDVNARNDVDAIFKKLDDVATLTGTRAGEVARFRFSDEAQMAFDHWRAELEKRIAAGTESPAFTAFLAKQRKTIPALALIFHLFAVAAVTEGQPLRGPVSVETLETACAWGEVFESHARSLYDAVIASPANYLAAKIERGDVTDRMRLRDVKRKKWSGLTSGADVEAAVDELTSRHWLRIDGVETGGKPARIVRLHPDFTAGREVPT